MRELILYGIAAGNTERWQEEILSTQCRNKAELEAIKERATRDGWHSFRVATWNGEAPDFLAAIGGKPCTASR